MLSAEIVPNSEPARPATTTRACGDDRGGAAADSARDLRAGYPEGYLPRQVPAHSAAAPPRSSPHARRRASRVLPHRREGVCRNPCRGVRGDVEGRGSLAFVRAATIAVGLLPIPLAIYAPDEGRDDADECGPRPRHVWRVEGEQDQDRESGAQGPIRDRQCLRGSGHPTGRDGDGSPAEAVRRGHPGLVRDFESIRHENSLAPGAERSQPSPCPASLLLLSQGSWRATHSGSTMPTWLWSSHWS
jgi:hypothetical protein